MKFAKFVSRFSLGVVLGFAAFFAVVPAYALGGDPTPPIFDMAAVSQALSALVLATIPALGAFVVRYLNAQYQNERAKLDERKLYMLDAFIRTVVIAAEQLKLTEAIDDKLDWVTVMAQTWLDERGISMNAEEIRARIEAAVKENFPKLPSRG